MLPEPSRSPADGGAPFAVLLRTLRERALLTQEQLAARAGLGVRTVRRLESDDLRQPRLESVRLIADALGLTDAERTRLTAACRGGPTPTERPQQLPTPAQMFTGRVAELADLGRVSEPSTVVITAIDGMAGVGKTALAVQLAHHLAERYPDGQLFIDLHGYTQGIAPVEPGEALNQMLRGLGTPGEQIPAHLDERAALYRSRLADQQMLILLDNAATEAQVQPLLPGTPGCLVLVTSRRRLAGLDHTHAVSLDVLPRPDAITLFARTVGEQRLTNQPRQLLTETVEMCGRLPLAIRIAAARLRSHPTWSVTHLLERLREHRHRLVELEAGQRSVAAALDVSYLHLTPDLQRVYRLLGLHAGPDLDTHAAAALLCVHIAEARRLLDHLLDAHLLQEPAPDRYRFHDLIRDHAKQAAMAADAESDHRAALSRLFDYYAGTALAAMDVLHPYEANQRPRALPPDTPTITMHDPTQAATWLDAELPNLLATAQHAADSGWHDRTLHLSATLHRHLCLRGHYRDAHTLHNRALTIARTTGNRAAEQDALNRIGGIYQLQSRYERAADHYAQALEIARTTRNRTAELDALNGLGRVHRIQDRCEEATDHYARALDIARTTGNRIAELSAMLGLGHLHRIQGRHEQATNHYTQALEIARTTRNRTAELDALNGLGRVHQWQGRYGQATNHLVRALDIARTTGNHIAELNAMLGLGGIRRRQGRYDEATDSYQEVLNLARGIGSRNYQLEATQGLGRLHHTTGNFESALSCHQQVLDLATELGQPADRARAHDGLAHVHYALGQRELAGQHWQHALNILSALRTTHTEDEEASIPTIRAHLAELDPGSAEVGGDQ